MNNRSNLLSFVLVTISFLLPFITPNAKAQGPVASCQVILANGEFLDESHYAFDLFLKSTNDASYPKGFHYANAQFRIEFNGALRNTVAAEHSMIQAFLASGTSEITNKAQRANLIRNPSAAQNYITIPGLMPVEYPESSVISNTGNGTRISRILLVSRDTVAHSYLPFTTGQSPDLKLSLTSPGGVKVYWCGEDGLPYQCVPVSFAYINMKKTGEKK
jgi:hypothetical protein